MSSSNNKKNNYGSRIVGAVAFIWFIAFLIYGGMIATDTVSRGISAILCAIGLVTAMTACFWEGAVTHHRGGGEHID